VTVLNFPISEKPLPRLPVLDMDKYWAFIRFYLRHVHNREGDAELRRKRSLTVPFRLHPTDQA